MLFILSCKDESNLGINEQNVLFVNSLKNFNDNQYSLERIDSVLTVTKTNSPLLPLLYLKKGITLTGLEKHGEAIRNFELALPLFVKLNDKEYLSKTYWHLGSANAFLDNIVEANSYLLKALQLAKEENDEKLEAHIYSSLAHTHFLYKDFQTSIDYSKKTIQVYKKLKDTVALSSSYNNMAVIYKNMGKFKKALDYNLRSLELNILHEDTSSIAKSHNNIGAALDELNKKEEALKHFLIAIELNKSKSVFNASPLINIGNLYLNAKDYEQAKNYYSQAIVIENKKNKIGSTLKLNENLLQIAIQESDLEKAFFYQKRSDSLKNVQLKKDADEKLNLLENQYKFLSSQQNLEIAQKLNSKNQTIFVIVLGSILLFGFIWFLYEKNKKLKTEKEKLRLEQKVLRSQMNPHFIFNALSAIQNSLMDNEPIKSASYLSKFAKLIRQNFDFIDKKKITLVDEIDALENYLLTQQFRLSEKFDYQINIQETIDIQFTEIPPMLLQPFIENAIEHGFKNISKKGLIILNITKGNQRIHYEILDNGKGTSILNNDGKTHAIDIFKKRVKLIGNKDESSFSFISSEEGTTIKFSLKE